MFDTALVLFVLAGFLIVVAISQPVATWLKLPQSVVLAAIGIGIGALRLPVNWAFPARSMSQHTSSLNCPSTPRFLFTSFCRCWFLKRESPRTLNELSKTLRRSCDPRYRRCDWVCAVAICTGASRRLSPAWLDRRHH
jgi:hypothetical protein